MGLAATTWRPTPSLYSTLTRLLRDLSFLLQPWLTRGTAGVSRSSTAMVSSARLLLLVIASLISFKDFLAWLCFFSSSLVLFASSDFLA